jgi:hypothetical protein
MDILDLKMPSKANVRTQYSGMDSINQCLDPAHFSSYPYVVNYNYNSQGFRDQEWPTNNTDLANAIWCIGDSFTVGVGSPVEHVWPLRLATLLNRRTINVSMDGASNDWIARTAKKIANSIAPKNIVIMWSFTHRREHPDSSLPDEQRIQHYVKSTVEQDWDNFLNCRREVAQTNSDIMEFVIPNFHRNDQILSMWNSIRGPSWPINPPETLEELYQLPHGIQTELNDFFNCFDKLQHSFEFQEQLLQQHNVIAVNQKDLARDGFHFDLITADWVANRVLQKLIQ